MPVVKPKCILTFSSEDPNNPASNLLNGDHFRRWKCKEPGKESEFVIFQLEKAVQFLAIDIGNEGSAFISVEVARSNPAGGDPVWNKLLLAQAFMTPQESREEKLPRRVKMFPSTKLEKPTVSEKWDLVKVICDQRFNLHIQYGLSFITFTSFNDPNTTNNSTPTRIGSFAIKQFDEEEDDSNVQIGSLFNRLKAGGALPNSSQPKSVATEIKQASLPISTNSDDEKESNRKRKLDKTSSPGSSKKKQINDSSSSALKKPNLSHDSPSQKKQKDSQSDPPSSSLSSTPKGAKSNSSASTTKNQQSNLSGPSTSSMPKSSVNSNLRKPFSRLFEGVTFVISGIENPVRAELRNKAQEMGARYKKDWDLTCTHLICAFVNTPKFNEVRRARNKVKGKIVKKDWILQSYRKKCRLPWRRYCLDRNDKGSDSEEEIQMKEDSESEVEVEEEDEEMKVEEDEKESLDMTSDKDESSRIQANISKKKKDSPNKKVKPLEISSDEEEKKSTNEIDDIYDADTDIDEDNIEEGKGSTSQSILDTNDPDAETDFVDSQELKNNKSSSSNSFSPNKRKSKKKDNNENDDEDRDKKSKRSSQSNSQPQAKVGEDRDDFFRNIGFFICSSEEGNSQIEEDEKDQLEDIILRRGGIVESKSNDQVQHVIVGRNEVWNDKFEKIQANFTDLMFVKLDWIFDCEKEKKMISNYDYVIAPDSD